MSREWKPGDLAIVTWAINADGAFPAVRGDGRWHKADDITRRWVDPEFMTDGWMDEHGGTARPLVVIDPEDAEQVQRLSQCYWGNRPNSATIEGWQAALREFANPTPPKSDEPTGLGAVVEDAEGKRWVRVDTNTPGCDSWTEADTGGSTETWVKYESIVAVRVLSPGVEADQ